MTAENVAKKYGITREEQDQFALASQLKAEAAIKAGKFKEEIFPVIIKGKKGDTVVEQDEFPRFGATLDGLAKLKPAFIKDGTVTAGNASGINDGAGAVVVMTEAEAMRRGLTPLARIAGWATRGVDPAIMGTGPIPACKALLEKLNWTIGDLDVIEANEAFAAQAVAVNRDMGWDINKVNVNGGAIAIGHPIGASGTRILVTLLHELKRSGGKKGIATLCIGGGNGHRSRGREITNFRYGKKKPVRKNRLFIRQFVAFLARVDFEKNPKHNIFLLFVDSSIFVWNYGVLGEWCFLSFNSSSHINVKDCTLLR